MLVTSVAYVFTSACRQAVHLKVILKINCSKQSKLLLLNKAYKKSLLEMAIKSNIQHEMFLI